MSSPGLEMTLDQIPVMMKKTQMSGEHGAQCGLTSLLPMSCRGRAAAFARDLHSRLRSLGPPHHGEDDVESTWLQASRDPTAPHQPNNGENSRDLETFYDFELECESPSSPVDEYEAPFTNRSPTELQVPPPFYECDVDPELKEQAKLKLQQEKSRTNGFRFATAFYSDTSPVKQQPAPRENGHVEKPLYSPITFEGCARQNSQDEIDCVAIPRVSEIVDPERISLPSQNTDSDSDFESAKSDPSEGVEEAVEKELTVANDISNDVEILAVAECETITEEILSIEITENPPIEISIVKGTTLEIITSKAFDSKEASPALEVDETLLSTEIKTDKELELEDDRPQRVRRCSSLKTGKTPPGTPSRKKIVRFADVLGLDLADVKTFMDEIPVIPKSAYDDLTGCDLVQNSPPVRAPPRFGTLTLAPLFQVPRDVTDILEKYNVCLESARVGDGVHITVCGSVRVRNLDFHKTVHIRYTMNNWKTYTDLQATYVSGSCDGYSDRFQFVLYAPCIVSGQRLALAVRFQCKGQQFWDNNSGVNYCYDCLALGAGNTAPASLPSPLHPTVDWHPSFY